MKTTEIINKAIQENQNDFDIYNELLELLKPFENKIINGITFKKFNTDLNKNSSSNCKVMFKDKSFDLGQYNKLFTIKEFERLNSWESNGSCDRIEKLSKLNYQKVENDYNTMIGLINDLKELMKSDTFDSFQNPVYYEITKEHYEVIKALKWFYIETTINE